MLSAQLAAAHDRDLLEAAASAYPIRRSRLRLRVRARRLGRRLAGR